MIEAPTLPFGQPKGRHASVPDQERLGRQDALSPDLERLVDVVAPDRYCAALLVEYAAPLFPAEIVKGSAFTVRLRPPARPGAALRVRLLVECWLEAVPLPCATVVHGDRSYLIRRQPSRGCVPRPGPDPFSAA